MRDPSDYDVLRTPDEPPPEPPAGGPPTAWIIVAVIVAIAAIVGAYWLLRRPAQPAAPVASPAPPVQQVAPAPQAQRSLGGEPYDVSVPALDASDPIVRELMKRVSTHPRVLAWLATDGLVRQFAMIVSNIGEGKTPASRLGVLKPQGSFQVVERNGATYVDPRSYERYDTIAAAAASIDPQGASRLYATLKPRIDEAYRALGVQGVPLDAAMERAIVTLLKTPEPGDSIQVEPKGGVYRFSDPALENLSAAQKQLLRTGPRNEREIKQALRKIAVALGIPEDRLPQPQG